MKIKQEITKNVLVDETDFMFQLSKEEFENLKCQIGTSKRKLPFELLSQILEDNVWRHTAKP